MKKSLIAILMALVMVLSVVLLTSCGGDASDNGDDQKNYLDLSQYAVYFASDSGEKTKLATSSLASLINSSYGTQVVAKEDYVADGESVPVGTKEILIGKTNRPESASLIGADDNALSYHVYFDGTRICVVGGSDEATAEGVYHLASMFKGDGLYINAGYKYDYTESYPCTSVKINGSPLDTYTIAYTDAALSKSFATELASVIAERTGVTLATASMASATGNIIVADEKTAIGADFVEGEKGYAIYVDNGALKVAYSNGNSAYASLKAFEEILTGDVELAGDYRLVKEANIIRLTMVGASNTAHGNILHWVDTILSTRYPDQLIDIINCGIGGDSAEGANGRLDWDVYVTNPDIVLFSFGCNGIIDKIGSLTGKVSATARKNTVKWFIEDMERLIVDAQARGVEVIITTPTPADEWMDAPEENYLNAYIGFDMMAEQLIELAAKYSIECLDYYQNITEYSQHYREKNGGTTEITVFTDRKHVNEAGAFAFAFSFAEDSDKWASEEVASVTIDATNGTSEANNAELDVKIATANQVVFSYKPNAIPLPATEGYNQLVGYDMIPINERNDEIIKVTGLADGEYTISFDGLVITTVTASELAEGVDIARLDKNPSQKAAKEVFSLYTTKKSNASKMRSDYYVQKNYLRKNGITFDSIEEKIAHYQQAIADGTATGNTKSSMESFIKNYTKYDGFIAENDACDFMVRVIANVDAYMVEIIKK